MGWKLWIVVGMLVLGFLLNMKDVWTPREFFRDEDQQRKIAFISLFVQAFFVYAILEAVWR
jgi:hypothetical protein